MLKLIKYANQQCELIRFNRLPGVDFPQRGFRWRAIFNGIIISAQVGLINFPVARFPMEKTLPRQQYANIEPINDTVPVTELTGICKLILNRTSLSEKTLQS